MATGLAGLMFLFSALSDFIAVMGPEDRNRDYWGAQGTPPTPAFIIP